MFSVRSRSRSSQLRRGVALLSTAALLAGTVGIPLPAGRIVKQTAEPYPCMDCSCGCTSAEMCWRNCCCHTQQEKVAWARKHNVTPPDYVLAAAASELRLAGRGARKCCCSKSKTCSPEPPANRPERLATADVVMFQALKCQGLGSHWVFVPLSVPPAEQIELLQLQPMEGVATETLYYTSYCAPPTTPPPQLV